MVDRRINNIPGQPIEFDGDEVDNIPKWVISTRSIPTREARLWTDYLVDNGSVWISEKKSYILVLNSPLEG